MYACMFILEHFSQFEKNLNTEVLYIYIYIYLFTIHVDLYVVKMDKQ